MPFLRRNPEQVAHTAPFGAAKLTNHPASTLPPCTRDITFAAPKSVSVLMALLPPEDSRLGALLTGHEAALANVLDWLDKEGAFALSGPAVLDCRGLDTAVVQHISSVGQQPHLHTHVLVEPTVTGVDGRTYPVDWNTLDQVLVAAGAMYLAVLRHNLVHTLGVTWTRDHHESKWEIAGIPDTLMTRWSDTTCALAAIPQTQAVRPR
ncbi:hypothetical protein GCM10010174_02820 [Kutzneria viridogrisea]|uniref:Conjugative relaxase-like TrwC/TraI family protein n=1 Tax=Kutzneria viridogrisea TaxID=47990 RepID=A0ABR6BD43_9PSEU|nr:conjugative relaxase-like TrwC/TraI family protein [Kutzneria viridogrisea]